MFSKFCVFCSLVTGLFFAKLANCRTTNDGTKYPCKPPYVAHIYGPHKICGGALLNELWIGLAKECLHEKLRRRSRKLAKVGYAPNTQIRILDETVSTVINKHSNISVVKVTKPFTINKYVSPAKLPTGRQCSEKKAVFILTTLDAARKLSKSICIKTDATNDCPPVIFPPGPSTMCGSVVDERNRIGIKDWGICRPNVKGPLMCKDQVQGFFLENSCDESMPDLGIMQFAKVSRDRKKIEEIILDGDWRSAKVYMLPRKVTQDGGQSHSVCQTNDLVVAMLLVLYFVHLMTY